MKLINAANVGNHVHLVVQISNRRTYKPFICALTGAIARTVCAKVRKSDDANTAQGLVKESKRAKRFWDFRPYSRIVEGYRAFLGLRDYLLINRLEGSGVARLKAVQLVHGQERRFRGSG